MIRVAWNEQYAHPLPENHRFPMEKYQLVPEQLEHEGTLESEAFSHRNLLLMRKFCRFMMRTIGRGSKDLS